MKKSFGILLLTAVVVVLAVFFFWKTPETADSAENTLVKAFDNSGARVISTEVYFSGKVEKNKESLAELKQYVEKLAGEMGVLRNDTFQSREIRNDSIEKVQVTGVTDLNRSVEINLENDEQAGTGERIITVSMADYGEISRLEEMKKAALQVLNRYGIYPECNSCIIGNFDGKLEDKKLNVLCNQILKATEAKKISTISDRNLVSVSAYSPFIEDSVDLQGKKMNLNFAVRYNSVEDKTYVWLATPVITVEY